MVAPVQGNKPAGGAATCSTEQAQDGFSNDDGDLIFCKVVAGPVNFRDKTVTRGYASVAVGAVYGLDTVADGTHQFTAWVKQASGLCGLQGIACGFEVTLCNDVDLDGTCTNIADNSDQLIYAQSNEAIVGNNCQDNDKDVKNCGTDDDAYASFCAKPTEEDVTSDDWNDGQAIITIGWWIDNVPSNIGAGLSIGTFDAWLVVGTSCTLPECDDDIDNDANGVTDYPDDPGCGGPFDVDETGVFVPE